METVRFDRWTVVSDVTRTRDAHSRLTRSGAEECGCDPCNNFHALRTQLLAGEFGALLTSLGIVPPWEVEAYHNARLSSGLHSYGGWFHFVGEIITGGSVGPPSSEARVWIPEFAPIAENVRVGFRSDCSLVREPFQGLPLVQLELDADLPWVIAAAEPS